MCTNLYNSIVIGELTKVSSFLCLEAHVRGVRGAGRGAWSVEPATVTPVPRLFILIKRPVLKVQIYETIVICDGRLRPNYIGRYMCTLTSKWLSILITVKQSGTLTTI